MWDETKERIEASGCSVGEQGSQGDFAIFQFIFMKYLCVHVVPALLLSYHDAFPFIQWKNRTN